MPSVTLPQGTYLGFEQDGVDVFRGIPYAAPFERFQPPVPPSKSTQEHDATTFGSNAPQKPSRLMLVNGPMPPNSGPQDEKHCGVLSVHSPAKRDALLPVIVFAHGGAFLSGGSQIPWYDGMRLARDGEVVSVCISYRLGAFGYFQDETDALACGTLDVIRALEWTRDNITAFGGDASNVTGHGQSAGAYHIKTMIQIRPDLLRRAILQSGPAEVGQSADIRVKARKAVEAALPSGKTLLTANTSELLEAQTQVIKTLVTGRLPPFTPSISEKHHQRSDEKKDILVGWAQDDGSCFAKLAGEDTAIQGAALTEAVFKAPSLTFGQLMKSQGHKVSFFQLTWAADDFELGATHCVDLPLIYGDGEAWKEAPVLGTTPWSEWERRGKILRRTWARFARDGTVPKSFDGVDVFSA